MHPSLSGVDWQQPVEWKHPLARNLLLWGLGDGRDLADNLPGTVEGSPTVEGGPACFTALKLNGSTDYVGYGDVLKTPQTMTITVAFRMPAFTTLWEYLAGKGGSTFRIQRAVDNPFLEAAFADGFFTPGTWCRATTHVDDGRWHTVTAIFVPGSRIAIYIDGVLENETFPAVSWPGTSDKPFTVGYNDSDLRWWGGSVAWWTIHADELSDAEVWELHAEGERGFPGLLRRRRHPGWFLPAQQPHYRIDLLGRDDASVAAGGGDGTRAVWQGSVGAMSVRAAISMAELAAAGAAVLAFEGTAGVNNLLGSDGTSIALGGSE